MPEASDGEISVNACCVGATLTFTCGDTVTESCTFNDDLTCSEGHGLIIGADNIVIDGNGYTLDGVSPGACDGLGIKRSGIYNKAYDDVVIKDLEVKNFCNGIYFKYDSEEGDRVERVTIDNCDIHHNGGDSGGDNSVHGIKAIGVFGSMIKNCEIHHNTGKGDSCEGGGNGIFLKGISGYGAWDNIIIHNEIYDNTKGGFFTKMMCTDTEVSYNELWGNGQGGVILRCMKSETHDIHHNNASYNYGSGIFIGGPNNTIRYNIASCNKNGSEYSGIGIGPGSGSPGKYGMGICMSRSDGSFHNEVLSNEVCGNEGVDIEVCPACEGNTGDDNTCDTTFNYDDEGTTGCTYSCDTAPPPAPVISSTTHPDEDVWYCNRNPTFNWTTPSAASGIACYSYALDHSASTTPDETCNTTENTKSYTDLAYNIWYFHVRAKDNADNWGPADHYRVKIENCDAKDGCYAYDNGCEDRDYYCDGTFCAYTYSNRHTDYYDDFVFYCKGDEVWKHRLYHDFYCEGGACSDHTSWVDDQLVENCNDY
ncbi:MAG TPA: hypothetical protein C5S37_09510, partial [Methanophagales archaeon]|nr:hypothetical protein [Methanophagales archaeon]